MKFIINIIIIICSYVVSEKV
jgi:hypothetical protein